MILYTLMPQEMIYPSETNVYENQTVKSYNGIPLLVEKESDGLYRVVRVMSSDPAHFLDDRCSPGAILTFM